MRKLTPDLLAACLDDIRSGRLTIDECLKMHPGQANELRLLLRTAISIAPLPVDLDPAFRLRGRVALIEAIHAEEEGVTKPPLRRFWGAVAGEWEQPARPIARRVPLPALIFAVLVMLTGSLGGGATYASQTALPGDTFYQVKTALEEIQAAFAIGDEAKTQSKAQCAERRLEETRKAIDDDRPEAAQSAAEYYSACVAKVEEYLSQAAASGKDVSELAALLSENLARQQATLAAAEVRAPEQAKDAVARAADRAESGLTTAIAITRSRQGAVDDRNPKATPSTTGTVSVQQRPQTPDRDGAKGKPGPTATVSNSIAITFTQVVSDVDNLAKDANVSGQSYVGLLAKLDAALAAIERGQGNGALHELDAFLNELNGMQRSGHINADSYDRLYAEYSAIVAELRETLGSQGPARPETKPVPKPQPGQRPDDDDRPKASPPPRPAPGSSPTQVVARPSPTREPKDSEDGQRGRPDDPPRRTTPVVAPTRVVAPPSPTPEPDDRDDHPRGRPEDAPRRPTAVAAPTQIKVPPPATPEPEDSDDHARERPDSVQRQPAPGATSTQLAAPPPRTPEPEESRGDGDRSRKSPTGQAPPPAADPTAAMVTMPPQSGVGTPGAATPQGRPDGRSDDKNDHPTPISAPPMPAAPTSPAPAPPAPAPTDHRLDMPQAERGHDSSGPSVQPPGPQKDNDKSKDKDKYKDGDKDKR